MTQETAGWAMSDKEVIELLLTALRPCVEYDGGQCLGDYPKLLALARAAIAVAEKRHV